MGGEANEDGESGEVAAGEVPRPTPAEPAAAAPPPEWRPAVSTKEWQRGRTSRRPMVFLVIGAIVALAVWTTGAIVLVTQLTDDSDPDEETDEPVPGAPTWHPDIEPIAHEVERIQGHEFEQPVAVKFLSDAEFDAQTLGGQLDQVPPQDLEDLGPLPEYVTQAFAALRAFGFSDLADDEILQLGNLPDPEGLQGFYDPLSETLFLRESEPDVVRDMIVAHELTHALDDQQFDLAALRRGAGNLGQGDVLQALIEGNANLTEDEYFDTLDPAAQEEYDEHESRLETTVDPGGGIFGLPLLRAQSGVPYVLGPLLVQVLRAEWGDEALGDAYESPPPAQALVDPTFALVRRSTGTVDNLEVAPGDEPIEDYAGEVDPLTFLFLLSGRIDPVPAIRAADAWSDSDSVTFTRNGVVCTTAAVLAFDEEGYTSIQRAMTDWVQTMPPASASIGSGREELETIFTACDPGEAATPPQHTLIEMMLPIVVRNAAIAELISEDGVDPGTAKCAANLVILDDELLGELTDEFEDDGSRFSEADELESELHDATGECEDA